MDSGQDMAEEHYRRVRQLFESALERPSSDRLAFLQRACADDEQIFNELRNLLAAHEASRSFLSAGLLPLANPREEFDGTERFEVLRRLGAGGFGIVYQVLDRQENAVVALKTLSYVMPVASTASNASSVPSPILPIQTSLRFTNLSLMAGSGSSPWSLSMESIFCCTPGRPGPNSMASPIFTAFARHWPGWRMESWRFTKPASSIAI